MGLGLDNTCKVDKEVVDILTSRHERVNTLFAWQIQSAYPFQAATKMAQFSSFPPVVGPVISELRFISSLV